MIVVIWGFGQLRQIGTTGNMRMARRQTMTGLLVGQNRCERMTTADIADGGTDPVRVLAAATRQTFALVFAAVRS
ncbi:MAG: hypothetical protein ACRECL_15340, partial [Bradyrhizobium sp.]